MKSRCQTGLCVNHVMTVGMWADDTSGADVAASESGGGGGGGGRTGTWPVSRPSVPGSAACHMQPWADYARSSAHPHKYTHILRTQLCNWIPYIHIEPCNDFASTPPSIWNYVWLDCREDVCCKHGNTFLRQLRASPVESATRAGALWYLQFPFAGPVLEFSNTIPFPVIVIHNQ